MTTTRAEPTALVLVDTNVLLAATDRNRTSHRAAIDLLNEDVRRPAIGPRAEGRATTLRLMALIGDQATGGRQVHDANLVAAALVHRVAAILTEDTRHLAPFAELVPSRISVPRLRKQAGGMGADAFTQAVATTSTVAATPGARAMRASVVTTVAPSTSASAT